MNLNVKLKSKGSYSDRVGLVVSNALIENKFSDTYSGVSEEVFNSNGHLVVQSVDAGLASGILRMRDIILRVDGNTIKTVNELKKYLEGKKKVDLILRRVTYFRDSVVFFDRYDTLEIGEVEYLKF